MGKRFFTALLALLLIGVQAFAQSAVSGKVTDEAGEPCVGANVLIKGTTTGTMTDLDGNYSLPHVKQGSILVFSSIGYSTQEVKVGTSSVINVVLQSDNRFLDEVVVVAYGTQKKKDVTGSIRCEVRHRRHSEHDHGLQSTGRSRSRPSGLNGRWPAWL